MQIRNYRPRNKSDNFDLYKGEKWRRMAHCIGRRHGEGTDKGRNSKYKFLGDHLKRNILQRRLRTCWVITQMLFKGKRKVR